MSIQKGLVKIFLEGKGNVFLMSEYEPKNCLKIKILDIERNKSFVGVVSDLDLRTQAAKIRLTFSDFINKSLKAILGSEKENNFIYILEEHDSFYIFKWKSVDDEETIIDMGSISMKDQPYVSAFDETLLSLAKEVHQLNAQIQTLSSDLVIYKNQAKNAADQLSNTIEIKNSLEEEMYAKFLLVLNEKKRKIAELSNNKSFQKLRIDQNHNVHKSKKQKSHTISDSSEDEQAMFPHLNIPGPSKIKKNDSLLFSDEDDVPVVPAKPIKKRNRNQGNKKRSFNDEIMSSNVESVLSQVIDDDSDDSLLGKL